MDVDRKIQKHPVLGDVVRILEEHHAQQIFVLEVGVVGTTIAEWFVIAEGYTLDHLWALRDALCDQIPPTHLEGKRGQDWLVVDYADVVVHLMLPEAREFYNLEGLWGDAPAWSSPSRKKEVKS